MNTLSQMYRYEWWVLNTNNNIHGIDDTLSETVNLTKINNDTN